MKTKSNKISFLIKKLLPVSLILSALLIPAQVFASTINLGTLDLRTTNGKETIEIEAKPGQQIQTEIQISNFSPETKEINFYLTDKDPSINSNENFQVLDLNSENNYVSNWGRLATNQLTLKSAESKIISLNFEIPQKAAIGNHNLAILARETKPSKNGGNIILEKGLRISLNIAGKELPNQSISNQTISTTENFIVLENTVKNTGNTILKGHFNFSLLNPSNQKIQENSLFVFLRPGESKIVTQKLDKPTLGIYSFNFSQDLIAKNYSFTETQFFYPEAFNYLAFSILFGFIYLAVRRLSPQKKIKRITISLRSPALVKSLSYATLSIIATIAFVGINSQLGSPTIYQANVFGESPLLDGYIAKIRWGNIYEKDILETHRQNWSGKITVENGKISIIKKLHNESTDSIRLVSDTELSFNHQTGPDNDGIEILIEPLVRDLTPKLIYHDDEKNRDYQFDLNDLNNQSVRISKRLHGFEIKTRPSPATGRGQYLPLSTDAYSTAEIQSTEEITKILEATPDLTDDLEILKDIFEDIPATSEVLTEYILNSDFVETVQTSNQTTEIKADSELIDTLAILPETIEEITATPELNFIFIPDEKIRFTPQQFSFSNRKITTQSMGQIIFVQNKNTAWNTYISISDFRSLSGKSTIPASSVSIDPGTPTIISNDNSQTQITTGEATNLESGIDQALLVNIQPSSEEEAIFVLNPRITIEIPAGTHPGVYQADIIFRTI